KDARGCAPGSLLCEGRQIWRGSAGKSAEGNQLHFRTGLCEQRSLAPHLRRSTRRRPLSLSEGNQSERSHALLGLSALPHRNSFHGSQTKRNSRSSRQTA